MLGEIVLDLVLDFVHDLVDRSTAVFLAGDGLAFLRDHLVLYLGVGLGEFLAIFFFGCFLAPLLEQILKGFIAESWDLLSERRAHWFTQQTDRIILGWTQHDLNVAAAGLSGEHAQFGAGAPDIGIHVGVFGKNVFNGTGHFLGFGQRRAGGSPVIDDKRALVHGGH